MKPGDVVNVRFTAKITNLSEYSATLTIPTRSGLEPIYIVPIEAISLSWEKTAQDKRDKAGA